MPLFFEGLDQTIFQWVNIRFANPFFDIFFPFITDLHKTDLFRYLFVPALVALVIYFRRWRGALIALDLTLSLALADKLGSWGKHFWQRPRPFQASIEVIQRSGAGGFSFPSNHAVNMFCTAFFLSSFFPKARWPLMLFAFLVAYSRVYNGVHYPLDVLAGAILGSFVGILGSEATKRLIRQIEARRHNGKRESNG